MDERLQLRDQAPTVDRLEELRHVELPSLKCDDPEARDHSAGPGPRRRSSGLPPGRPRSPSAADRQRKNPPAWAGGFFIPPRIACRSDMELARSGHALKAASPPTDRAVETLRHASRAASLIVLPVAATFGADDTLRHAWRAASLIVFATWAASRSWRKSVRSFAPRPLDGLPLLAEVGQVLSSDRAGRGDTPGKQDRAGNDAERADPEYRLRRLRHGGYRPP